MVCVGAGCFSPDLLRAGAEAAARLHSDWYAVYVEPEAADPRDVPSLGRTITLAEQLGGTVVGIKAMDPVEGLVAFARRESVTHVLFAADAGAIGRERFLAGMKGLLMHELRAGRVIDLTPSPIASDGYRRPGAWLAIAIGLFVGLVLVRAPAMLMLAVAIVVAVLWCRCLEGLS